MEKSYTKKNKAGEITKVDVSSNVNTSSSVSKKSLLKKHVNSNSDAAAFGSGEGSCSDATRHFTTNAQSSISEYVDLTGVCSLVDFSSLSSYTRTEFAWIAPLFKTKIVKRVDVGFRRKVEKASTQVSDKIFDLMEDDNMADVVAEMKKMSSALLEVMVLLGNEDGAGDGGSESVQNITPVTKVAEERFTPNRSERESNNVADVITPASLGRASSQNLQSPLRLLVTSLARIEGTGNWTFLKI